MCPLTSAGFDISQRNGTSPFVILQAHQYRTNKLPSISVQNLPGTVVCRHEVSLSTTSFPGTGLWHT